MVCVHCMEDDCNVKGCFIYSLLDNWELAAGFYSRFDLSFVDYCIEFCTLWNFGIRTCFIIYDYRCIIWNIFLLLFHFTLSAMNGKHSLKVATEFAFYKFICSSYVIVWLFAISDFFFRAWYYSCLLWCVFTTTYYIYIFKP